MDKIAAHAGLRHVHNHMLRHTFASHAVMRGVPLRQVQEWLGTAASRSPCATRTWPTATGTI